MNRIIKLILFVLILPAALFAQNFGLEYKSIADTNKEKNYTINIRYTQIEGSSILSEAGYNKLAEAMMQTHADSFRVWMNDWESYNKEMGSFYEINDTALYFDSKIISTLFYEFYYFSGAAHPNNSNFSLSYDIENNKQIKLGDLFTGDYLKVLSGICIDEISKTKKGYDPSFNVKDR